MVLCRFFLLGGLDTTQPHFPLSSEVGFPFLRFTIDAPLRPLSFRGAPLLLDDGLNPCCPLLPLAVFVGMS